MQPTETGKAYDQITHLWEREGFDRNNGMEAHRRAIAMVETRNKALDVGCGCTGRFIELFQAEGFTAEGVDTSEEMLRIARLKHPDITFTHADICQWTLPGQYDLISAWDSIWHVPLAHQPQLLNKLMDGLSPGGVLIFSCGGTDEANEHSNQAMGPEVYYASLGVNGYLALFAQLDCTVRHFEYDQYPELHCYFIVQKAG